MERKKNDMGGLGVSSVRQFRIGQREQRMAFLASKMSAHYSAVAAVVRKNLEAMPPGDRLKAKIAMEGFEEARDQWTRELGG